MKEKYTATYDEQNEILCLKFFGLLAKEDMDGFLTRVQELFEGKRRRYLLIDMSEGSKLDTGSMTKEMRNTYKEFMDMMEADKSAIFGASPAIRMISKIAIAVTGKKVKTQFFKTREEALAWLKGDEASSG